MDMGYEELKKKGALEGGEGQEKNDEWKEITGT